jgi:hypothetical protein
MNRKTFLLPLVAALVAAPVAAQAHDSDIAAAVDEVPEMPRLAPVRTASTAPAPADKKKSDAAPKGDDFDFDNFDSPSTTPAPAAALGPQVDESAVKSRRLMLNLHQAVGMLLVAGTVGSIVTGQLNYNDKFGGDNSDRYRLAHQIFTYPTIGLAAVTAGFAIAAPVPIKKDERFSRMTIHKIGQFTGLVGWLAQLGLGLWTVGREGYTNQKAIGMAHLVVGYATIAGLAVGEGAVVF